MQYSLDGTTWIDAAPLIPRHDPTLAVGTSQWKQKTVTLPAGAGNQPTLYVGFKFHSGFGDNCSMDNLIIQPTPTCIAPSNPQRLSNCDHSKFKLDGFTIITIERLSMGIAYERCVW